MLTFNKTQRRNLIDVYNNTNNEIRNGKFSFLFKKKNKIFQNFNLLDNGTLGIFIISNLTFTAIDSNSICKLSFYFIIVHISYFRNRLNCNIMLFMNEECS